MSNRLYTLSFANVSVSAAQDLLAIYAGSSMAFQVDEVQLTQSTGTTVAILRCSYKILPATVTAGSGGSSQTPGKTSKNDPSATVTGRKNDTTQATTSGTALTMPDGFNVVNGLLWVPMPDDRWTVNPSEAFVFSLDQAPASALTMSGRIVFREII